MAEGQARPLSDSISSPQTDTPTLPGRGWGRSEGGVGWGPGFKALPLPRNGVYVRVGRSTIGGAQPAVPRGGRVCTEFSMNKNQIIRL